MLSRFLPLVGVLLFLFAAFVWRAWIQYQRYGHVGVFVFPASSWGKLLHALFVFLLLLIVIQAAAVAISPESLANFYLFPAPSCEGVLLTGILLLLGGTVFTVVAQLQLGASWRIGIEEGASPGLVTGGLYRFCRNPIFFGSFISLAGLIILLPTWLSVGFLLATIVGVRCQVLEEEAYLLRTYGEEYRSYARRVGRFLPGIGRLSG
jgi:protein-S-isoprenylcysteine O-methyltransferase Ste14